MSGRTEQRARIGALRHRVVLEAPDRISDGGGGATVTWSTVAELWASIDPRSGGERLVGEGVAGGMSHVIAVRYRSGVEPAMRFRLGSRRFEILASRDIDERRRVLVCDCREELL